MLDVVRVLKGGKSLADSLGAHPSHFPELYVNMVRAGEASGSLAQIFERLAEFERTRDDLRGYIVSSLIYPALLTLVGLITKHGILMVEFANELQLNEGLDKRSAIEMAARIRLRPILMTTAAMVTGLIPLLTATGAGAASRFSIGLVVVSGMSIGTLFTLFVLPAVYVWLATDHQAKADSERTREIADFDLGRPVLKPT